MRHTDWLEVFAWFFVTLIVGSSAVITVLGAALIWKSFGG